MADVTTLSGKKIALGWPLCHVDISKRWFKAHNSHTPTSRSCCSFVGPCSYHSNPILPDIKIFSVQRPCRFFVQNEKCELLQVRRDETRFFLNSKCWDFTCWPSRKHNLQRITPKNKPPPTWQCCSQDLKGVCFFSIRVRLSDHKMSKTSNYLEDHPPFNMACSNPLPV